MDHLDNQDAEKTTTMETVNVEGLIREAGIVALVALHAQKPHPSYDFSQRGIAAAFWDATNAEQRTGIINTYLDEVTPTFPVARLEFERGDYNHAIRCYEIAKRWAVEHGLASHPYLRGIISRPDHPQCPSAMREAPLELLEDPQWRIYMEFWCYDAVTLVDLNAMEKPGDTRFFFNEKLMPPPITVTDVPVEFYKCGMCHGIFQKMQDAQWSDTLANEEARARTGLEDASNNPAFGIVCDDCHNKLLGFMAQEKAGGDNVPVLGDASAPKAPTQE